MCNAKFTLLNIESMMRKTQILFAAIVLLLLNSQVFAQNAVNNKEECSTTFNPLVIQIEFSGIARKNIDSTKVKEKFLTRLNDYVREMSYNRVCIKGEITDKWYRLAGSVDQYYVPWQNQKANRSIIGDLVNDSLDAVEKDFDVSKYDFVIIALAANAKQWGNNGIAAYPGMLGWKSNEVLTTHSGRKVNRGIAVFASTVDLGHVFHDVAHVIAGVIDGNRVLPCLYDQDMQGSSSIQAGAWGASSARTKAEIHMGSWDPMSCNNCRDRPSPPGISSWTRLRLNWMPDSKIRLVSPGEKVEVALGPIEDAASRTTVIKIPLTATTYYLIENRQAIGFDKFLPQSGIIIMYADDKIPESRHGKAPVDIISADPSVEHFENAAFDIGKNDSFTDEKNGVKIKLLKKNDKTYEIAVEHTVL